MSSKIAELKTAFAKLTTIEKQKEFITNLKEKIKNSKNKEYIKFLNECIRKHNAEVLKVSPNAKSEMKPSNSPSSSFSSKQKGGVDMTKESILGKWVHTHPLTPDTVLTYEFLSNETYNYSNSESGASSSGTYFISKNEIICSSPSSFVLRDGKLVQYKRGKEVFTYNRAY